MKKIFIRTCILVAAILVSHSGQAQISSFKLTNGIQTPMKEGDKFEILVDKDNHVQINPNVLVQIDLAAFKKKYKYDVLQVRLFCKTNGYTFNYNRDKSNIEAAYETLEFADPLFVKKYANQKTLQFYLFKTDETNAPNSFSLIRNNTFWFDPYHEKDEYQLLVEGLYVTGQEEYYDKNSQSWKKRNIYSEPERVSLCAQVDFEMSEEWKFADRYKRLVIPGETKQKDESGKTLRGLSSISYELEKVSKRMAKYTMIAQAIKTVSDNMVNTVKAESDPKKQIELVIEWNTKAQSLIVDESDPANLKILNKELKMATDANAILEIFKKYNPNGRMPE